MVVFPHAKINIGLQIIEKRPDGFHSINTLFYPIPFHDILEIVPADKTSINISGLKIEGGEDDNLCMKAYQLLHSKFSLPPAAIYLHKVIPAGAGLGGGSSDAAYTLTELNRLFDLQLSRVQLMAFATKLGSDCTFFIQEKPAFAEGRGEILYPTSINLQGYYLLLIKPDIHISTATAYAGIIPKQPEQKISLLAKCPVSEWRNGIHNDFEAGIFAQYPVLADIKAQLYSSGAEYASMSGSGASIFGLFADEEAWQRAARTLQSVIFSSRL
jgi:4-diphosphocytidyl-2-C-methyl-D-erythritol kinase